MAILRTYCTTCHYLQTSKNRAILYTKCYTDRALHNGPQSVLLQPQLQTSNSVISQYLLPNIKHSRNLCNSSHSVVQNRPLQQWKSMRLFSTTSVRKCAYSHEWIRKIVCCVPKELRTSPPWRIMFFGSDEFSLVTLKALNENRLSNDPDIPRLVDSLDVTMIRPKVMKFKDHHPVREYALEHGLTLHDWPVVVSPFKYDVGVLASFGRLVPESVIFKFPYGIINVHPSLLPRWRGASPITHTILNGDEETGISIMEIRPKYFDIGPLLLKVPYDVPEDITTPELTAYMAKEGAKVLMQTLPNLPELEKSEVEQNKTGVTWAHKVTAEMSVVDWKNHTCKQIDQMYRALHERFPLTTHMKGDTVRLLNMKKNVNDEDIDTLVKQRYDLSREDTPPGFPVFCKVRKAMFVKCKDGWVGFESVQHTLRQIKVLTFQQFYGVYKRIYRDEIFSSPPEKDSTQHRDQDTPLPTESKSALSPKQTGIASHFTFYTYESSS